MTATVVLKRGKEKRLLAGHPWVYAGEVEEIRGQPTPGEVVAITTWAGHALGWGYINPHSQILVRRLTEREEPVDEEFFRRRIAAALAYREEILPGITSCRLVFGEGDFLPGLVVDRFEDVLVVQFLTLGMEIRRPMILRILTDLVQPRGIWERSDAHTRLLEGLEPRNGLVAGEVPSSLVIRENDLAFQVDLARGQKTGYFFDQKLNRRALAPLVKGRRVLDAFTYTGSFAIHAAFYGAREVIGWDISPEAVAWAKQNAVLNHLEERCHFFQANAFDALRQAERAGERFDVVILDPPAFVKSRESLEGALRGYKEINLRAMRLLTDGGFLVTASCSFHVSRELFLQVLAAAAEDSRCHLRLLELRGQSPDHPVLLGVPETSYLKFAIFQVFRRK